MPVTSPLPAWLKLFRRRLREWESAALDAWLEKENPEIREIGERQLGFVMWAGRLFRGREVYLRYPPLRFVTEEFPLFPNFPIEKQLAEVRMSINGHKVKCQVWAIRGRVSMLEFTKLPRLFLRAAHVEVLGVKTGPFPSDRTGEDLAYLLPPDYVELVRASGPGGLDFPGGIGVMRLDQVYMANLDGGQYWLLAEKPDIGMIGVPVEDGNRDIQFLFYDGRRAKTLSPSFGKALELARDIE